MLKLDPRAKLCASASLTLVSVFTRDLRALLPALAVSTLFCALSGVNPARVMLRLRRLVIIIAGAALLQSVFVRSGAVLLELGGVALLTTGGLMGGGLILARMGVLLICGAAVAAGGARQNIQALVQLKLPYELAFMTCVGLHFIPVLTRELQDSLIAVQLRGIDLRRIAVRKRARVYAYIFLPAMASAIIKARDLAASVELRGFRAYPTRTSLIRLKMRAPDWAVCAIFIGGAAAALIFY